MKFLISQYCHIEGYPPTFNTINILAKKNYEVTVLARKDMPTKWNYPANVNLNFIGNYNNRYEFEKTSKVHKIKEFLKYVVKLFLLIRSRTPDYILLYDNIPLMAFMLVNPFVNKTKKVWYHNHDINNIKDYKRYSLNHLAFFFEKRAFKRIDIFSLPAIERKKYFNLSKFKGEFYIIPNYPPLYLFNQISVSTNNNINDEIRLVYPGNIDNKHGFEEIIPFLKNKILSKQVSLTLIGDIRPKYKAYLIELSEKHNVGDKLVFNERSSYLHMPEIISKFHVGIGINKPMNITRATGGTAANKIYEFAACGLPVLLFDNEHYRNHLAKFSWAFFTNLTETNLTRCLEKILPSYKHLSKQAKEDFTTNLNYEKALQKAL